MRDPGFGEGDSVPEGQTLEQLVEDRGARSVQKPIRQLKMSNRRRTPTPLAVEDQGSSLSGQVRQQVDLEQFVNFRTADFRNYRCLR